MEPTKTEVTIHGTKVKGVSYLIVLDPGQWGQDDDMYIHLKFSNATVMIPTNEALDTTKPLRLIVEADLAKPFQPPIP